MFILELCVFPAPGHVPASQLMKPGLRQPVFPPPSLAWHLLELPVLIQTQGGPQSFTAVKFRISTAQDPNLSLGLLARSFLEAFIEEAYLDSVIQFLDVYLCFK